MARYTRMDEELFRKKLSEVATWRIPEIKETAGEIKKRGKRSNEERYQALHEKTFFEIYGNVNPSHPIQLKDVKRKGEICGDCGIICNRGREKDYKLYQGKEKTTWREKCIECGKYKNPYTQRFELDSLKAQSALNSYINGSETSSYATLDSESKQEI